MRRGGLALALVLLSTTPEALAQGPTMGDGEAVIGVRSDVKLGIKGTLGTTSERLQQLSDVVADQMGELRKCYSRLVAKRPSSVGALAIRLTLERAAGPRPKLETKEQGGTEPELTKCVERVLRRAQFKGVGRPAAAIITLDFQNTRAQGQKEMAQRRVEAHDVAVSERAEGGYEASWGTPDGRVEFRVQAGPASSREAVAHALMGFRRSFAGFLDCRRRCEKGGLSPAGDTVVDLRLARGGKASAEVKSTSVPHRRATPCIERALKRLTFENAPAGQRVNVTITFGP